MCLYRPFIFVTDGMPYGSLATRLRVGQVENTEVQKPKYGNGSEKKSRLSVFCVLLTNECVC